MKTAIFAALSAMAAFAPAAAVPELLVTFSGVKTETREAWERTRRPEILEKFEREEFGARPAAADDRSRVSFESVAVESVFGGKAEKKLVRADYKGPAGDFSFLFTAYVPAAGRPVPAFIHIALARAPVSPSGEVLPDSRWPVEEILSRGFATASYVVTNIAADANRGFSQGVFPAVEAASERTDESWATLSAWAWGASKILDWMETEPAIDAEKVAVVGHSRGGKTALWAGATDRRFAMACSNGSGCAGAKLNHMELPKSEGIAKIVSRFPYWFCANYAKYAGREQEMDFDQHELLALMAPRLLCVGSGSGDVWAGPEGEWESAVLASRAWELYGEKPLPPGPVPAPGGVCQKGCVSYHIHDGPHRISIEDWNVYIDFFARKIAERGGAPVSAK